MWQAGDRLGGEWGQDVPGMDWDWKFRLRASRGFVGGSGDRGFTTAPTGENRSRRRLLRGEFSAGDDEVDGMDHSRCLGDKRVFRSDIRGEKGSGFLETARACAPDCDRTPGFPGRSRLARLRLGGYQDGRGNPRAWRKGFDFVRAIPVFQNPSFLAVAATLF